MRFKLIMALVNPEKTNLVVETAKNAGATGDVIIPARGAGMNQARIMGISITDKTDVVLFIVEEHIVKEILEAVEKVCDLDDPGNGVAIILSIDKVVGLSRQIEKIKDRLREEQL